MKRILVVLIAFAIVAGCTHPRFADRAVLWHDSDDKPVAVPRQRPEPGPTRWYTGANDGVFRPAHRFLSVDYGLEAVNVNAVDEVPDSTWYTDRRRDPRDPNRPPRSFTVEEIGRGAVSDDPPQRPFIIRRTLEGGSAIGFVVDDARGRRYALKLDPLDHLGLISSTDVVAARLAWGAGYNVPANEIVDFAYTDLAVAADATMEDQWGRRSRLDRGEVASMLSLAARAPDGRWQAVASRWLPGRILGPFTWLGREHSDGNDRYDHQNRRDLRGFGVWASWVDNIDAMESNTLDTYVGEPGHGHVVHYQLDVGGSFGAFSAKQAEY